MFLLSAREKSVAFYLTRTTTALHRTAAPTRDANRTCVAYPIGTGQDEAVLNRKKGSWVNRLGIGPWTWVTQATSLERSLQIT